VEPAVQLPGEGTHFRMLEMDVTNQVSVDGAVNLIMEKRQIDVPVNNAGISGAGLFRP